MRAALRPSSAYLRRGAAYLATTPPSLYMKRMTTIDEIVENFALLDEWDDRYRYVIELGRALPPLARAPIRKLIRSRAAQARCGCSRT